MVVMVTVIVAVVVVVLMIIVMVTAAAVISLDWVLSHWARFTVRRFICVYLCLFCVFLFHTA